MSRIKPDLKFAALLFAFCVTGATPDAAAQGPAGLSGVYSNQDGTLAIVEGTNETLVHYATGFPQGNSTGTCDCALVVQMKGASSWTLHQGGEDDAWTMSITPKQLVLTTGAPTCCGAGYPGKDSFARAPVRPLSTCKVKVPKAGFFASDAANTPRKTFVVSGDAVEAYVDPVEPDYLAARFQGPRQATVGLLKREDLACPADAASKAASTPPPVSADKLQPFAGTWVALTKQGKGFVIFKPCSAMTRSFTVKPATGELEVQLGQEATTLKVTSVAPGKGAGAWALGLTSPEGKQEALQWKTVDAAKGTVSVTSPDLFSKSHDYVRQEKRSEFPMKQETGCEEYEH